MPLYEYRCEKCGGDCELLVRNDNDIECPKCGSKKLERQLSVVASPTISSHSSGARMADLPLAGCGRPQCGQGRCMGME